MNNTGSGTWNIYGGNQSGGTLKGNVTINVNNTVSGISTIAGGANVGTIDGNTKVAIKQLNGTLTNYYGGGVGSSATNAANVTGNVETTIATKNANFRLGTFVGGVQYGTIDGVESTALFPVVEAGLGQPIVLSAVPIMEILARNLLKRPS